MSEEISIDFGGQEIQVTLDTGTISVFDTENADGVINQILADSAQAITTADQALATADAQAALIADKAQFDLSNVNPATGRTALDAPSATALALPSGGALIGTIRAETGAVFRTVQDVLRDRVSIKDFGAVGDGVDRQLSGTLSIGTVNGPVSTVGWTLAQWQAIYPFVTSLTQRLDYCALQAAVNTGNLVEIPAGTYYMGVDTVTIAPVSGSGGATIEGAGSRHVAFGFSAAAGDCFRFNGTSRNGIHGCRVFFTGGKRTAGVVHFDNCNDVSSYGMQIRAEDDTDTFYVAYLVTSGPAQFKTVIEGYQIERGDHHILLGPTADLVQDTFIGKGVTGRAQISGIELLNCKGVYIYDWPDFIRCKTGLRINPSPGRYVAAVLCSGMLLDTSDFHGVLIQTSGGFVANLDMNIWSASAGTAVSPPTPTSSLCSGIFIDEGAGKIDGVKISGTFYNNVSAGVVVLAARNVQIADANIGYNSVQSSGAFPGVFIGPDAVDCSVIGGWSGPFGEFRANLGLPNNQTYGVQIDTGALRTTVNGVNVVNNGITGVLNLGTESLISNCPGYRTKASGLSVIPSGATFLDVLVPIDAPLLVERVQVQSFGAQFLWPTSAVGQTVRVTAAGPVPGDTFFQINVDQSF